MIDTISKREEGSGFGEGRGEAQGMLGGARVKLIQCRMKRMKGSFSGLDPPQSASGSWAEKAAFTTMKVSEAKMTVQNHAKY